MSDGDETKASAVAEPLGREVWEMREAAAVRFCEEAGEGATLDLRIGGKVDKASGLPVDLRPTVKKIVHDAAQPFGKSTNLLGTAVSGCRWTATSTWC